LIVFVLQGAARCFFTVLSSLHVVASLSLSIEGRPAPTSSRSSKLREEEAVRGERRDGGASSGDLADDLVFPLVLSLALLEQRNALPPLQRRKETRLSLLMHCDNRNANTTRSKGSDEKASLSLIIASFLTTSFENEKKLSLSPHAGQRRRPGPARGHPAPARRRPRAGRPRGAPSLRRRGRRAPEGRRGPGRRLRGHRPLRLAGRRLEQAAVVAEQLRLSGIRCRRRRRRCRCRGGAAAAATARRRGREEGREGRQGRCCCRRRRRRSGGGKAREGEGGSD